MVYLETKIRFRYLIEHVKTATSTNCHCITRASCDVLHNTPHKFGSQVKCIIVHELQTPKFSGGKCLQVFNVSSLFSYAFTPPLNSFFDAMPTTRLTSGIINLMRNPSMIPFVCQNLFIPDFIFPGKSSDLHLGCKWMWHVQKGEYIASMHSLRNLCAEDSI
jgi:hypothetical protein